MSIVFGPIRTAQFLIKLGADVREATGEDNAMRWAFFVRMELGFVVPRLFPDRRCAALHRDSLAETARDGTLTIRTGSAVFAEPSPKLRPTMQFATWNESSRQAPLSSHSFKTSCARHG